MAEDPEPKLVPKGDARLAVAAVLIAGKDGEVIGKATLLSSNIAVTASKVASSALKLGGPFGLVFPQFIGSPGVYPVPAEIGAVDSVLGFGVLSFSGMLPHPVPAGLLGTGATPAEGTDCSVLYYHDDRKGFFQLSGTVPGHGLTFACNTI